VTIRHGVDEILADLRAATIPSTRIFDIHQVSELPQLKANLTRTAMPNGKTIRMQPMAVDIEDAAGEMRFPPKYGADTNRVLAQAGYAQADIAALAANGIVA
jgi:crotonobetainyl-CoA:carnitine CoA-transferase CaiB-like acyl-CoA transferase